VPGDDAWVALAEDAQIDPGHLLLPYAVRWLRLIAFRSGTRYRLSLDGRL
jgi:hypothetical protein